MLFFVMYSFFYIHVSHLQVFPIEVSFFSAKYLLKQQLLVMLCVERELLTGYSNGRILLINSKLLHFLLHGF